MSIIRIIIKQQILFPAKCCYCKIEFQSPARCHSGVLESISSSLKDSCPRVDVVARVTFEHADNACTW